MPRTCMGEFMATNSVHASYTEVVDLQTVSGSMSVIGIHTPVGIRPYTRLNGFFRQFRKYKYHGISSLVMVPAANLPVDPLGLTGMVGTTDLMDPRDALNPILFHGAHGEHLSSVLDTIYSSTEYVGSTGGNATATFGSTNHLSNSLYESKVAPTAGEFGDYYRCLTDTSWRKFGIQSGVRLRHLHPLVHRLARNMPLYPGFVSGDTVAQNAGMLTGVHSDVDLNDSYQDTPQTPGAANQGYGPDTVTNPVGQVPTVTQYGVFSATGQAFTRNRPAYVQEMTNGMSRLGWMPTSVIPQTVSPKPTVATLPKLFMGVLALPPSYNVEQFFRMVIRHEFSFCDFTTSLDLEDYGTWPNNGTDVPPGHSYYNWIDYGTAGSKDEKDDPVAVGDTIDMIGGKSELISDGVA